MSNIFSYNSVNNGSVVSYVLKFAYSFSVIGTKLSKYSSLSIDCDKIISSSLKLYFTFIRGKILRSNINARILLYLIISSAILAIYKTSLSCDGLRRFVFGITNLHFCSLSVSFIQYFVSLHVLGFLLIKQLVVISLMFFNISSL